MPVTAQQLLRQVRESRLQFKTRQQLWHHYLSLIEHGDVCAEFGVWRGGSINYMAKVRPDNTFHGFDSFEGLPEDWIANHPTGHFKVPDKTALKWAPNVQIHEGQFDDSVPEFRLEQPEEFDRTRFFHIDCDLGSSAATVLYECYGPIIRNKAWLLFDEFYGYEGYEEHEFKAFLQLVNLRKVRYHIEARNTRHQQVLIRIL